VQTKKFLKTTIIITQDKIIEIYCLADSFCKVFFCQLQKCQLTASKITSKHHHDSCLPGAGVIMILHQREELPFAGRPHCQLVATSQRCFRFAARPPKALRIALRQIESIIKFADNGQWGCTDDEEHRA